MRNIGTAKIELRGKVCVGGGETVQAKASLKSIVRFMQKSGEPEDRNILSGEFPNSNTSK